MTDEIQKIDDKKNAVAAFDYSQFEGTGFENTSTKDLTTPFIYPLQDLSKATKQHEPAFVPGARPGMFLNTGTRELIPGETGFAMVPLLIDHCIAEWKKDSKFPIKHPVDCQLYAEAKARFEASRDPNKSMAKDITTPEGAKLQETYYLWALILDQDGETPIGGAIIPFKSSNIKKYRKEVYTPLQSFKGAGGKLYVHRQRCTLVIETGPKGSSFNYRFEPLRGSIKDSLIDPTSGLQRTAYEVFLSIREGKTKMAEETQDVAEASDAETRDEVFS